MTYRDENATTALTPPPPSPRPLSPWMGGGGGVHLAVVG